MSYIQQNLKYLRLKNGLSQTELAEILEVTRDNIASYERGTKPKVDFINRCVNYFHISFDDFVNGDLSTSNLIAEPKTNYKTKPKSNAVSMGEIQINEEESPYIDLGNGQLLMIVPLIPIKASASYREHYQDTHFINDNFDKHYFPVTRQYRGRYFAFVVDGDSMDDGTKEAIEEGSTVTGREIQKIHWRNKFHLHSFKDYVIVHNDAIFVKRIINHDTVNGIITCHSLNPDKIKHADFDLKLDDCLQILNIVNVTRSI